MIVKQIDDPS